jgi:hypothetical protein
VGRIFRLNFSSNDPLQEGIDKALPIVIDRLRQAA